MRNWITLLIGTQLGATLVHTSACQRHDGERPPVKVVATAAVPNQIAPVALNTGSDAVGHVLFSLLEAKLSSEPGAPPHTTARGTPALVVDERVVAAERWLRVISADGAYGWTPLSASATAPQAHSTVLLSRDNEWHLTDSATIGGDAEHVSISGRSGRVVGGSDDPMVSRIQHLSVATYKNAHWTPWVRVQVGEHVGFAPLPEHTLTGKSSPNTTTTAPRGLVQRWALNTLPAPNSCPQELSRVETALGRVSLQRCDSEAWLAVTRPGAEPSRAAVDEDAAWILRYEELDLNADGALDWALEVVSSGSHGAGSELLLLLAGATEPQRVPSTHQFSWQVERSDPPTLWVVSEGDLKARAYRMADGRLNATGGWVAHSREPQPHLHAQRVALRDDAAVAYVEEPDRFIQWSGFSSQPPGKITTRSDFAIIRVGPDGAVLAL